jgi:hypothetical protein
MQLFIFFQLVLKKISRFSAPYLFDRIIFLFIVFMSLFSIELPLSTYTSAWSTTVLNPYSKFLLSCPNLRLIFHF